MKKYRGLRGIAGITVSTRQIRTQGGDIHDLKVRCVCGPCNNGWMRKLESRVRPLIVPLLDGQRVRLLPSDYKSIAVWAGMNAMVMEYERLGHVTTHHTQRRMLMNKGELPKIGWKIWIGNFVRNESRMHYASHPFFFIHGKIKKSLGQPTTYFNGNATTQVVKQLFIHIIRSPVSFVVDRWQFDSAVAGKLRVIWPTSDISIIWPPQIIGDDEAEYLATAFYTALERSTREALARGEA